MIYRYERKFSSDISNIDLYYNFLTINNFIKVYKSRKVNSVYFDKNFISANQNLDGVSEKKKFRLRWYDNFKNPRLEIKIKKGFINTKEIEIIKFKDTKTQENKLKFLIESSQELLKLKKYFNLKPTSIVSYKREYFNHIFFKDIRLTIDKNIRFGYYGSNVKVPRMNIVMEIKYPIKIDSMVMRLLKFQKTNIKLRKFSKYVNSILIMQKKIALT